MSVLANVYITKKQIEDLSKLCEFEKGLSLTVSIQDEQDKYENNTALYYQKEKDAPKTFLGNGIVFWTNGIIKAFKKTKKNG